MSADSVKDLLKACEDPKAPNKPLPQDSVTDKSTLKELDKDAPKPVGVVKATPRGIPDDSKRSTNNTIKQDEVNIVFIAAKLPPHATRGSSIIGAPPHETRGG